MTDFPLYVWCSGCKQVLIIGSSNDNALQASAKSINEGFRYQTFDPNYSKDSLFRFGSYLYAGNKWISGSWHVSGIEYMDKEFKANLLLMGVLDE